MALSLAMVLRDGSIGGRVAAPGTGADPFLAVTLLALVAAVIIPAARGG